MITEPEIEDGTGQDGSPDLLSGGERPPRTGGSVGRRPWLWALGGIVAASAIWAATLHASGYGRTEAPDPRGYHLGADPCTAVNLLPLTDAFGVESFDAGPAVTHKGSTVDHLACTLAAVRSGGEGWTTRYVATVTVDLHRRTDPRTEFDDAARTQSLTPAVAGPGVYVPDPAPATTRPVTGLGDRAYLTGSDTRQSLDVLDGGAVLTLTVDATVQWWGIGSPAPSSDGSVVRSALADTKSLRPQLVPTMRRVMRAMSAPADS